MSVISLAQEPSYFMAAPTLPPPTQWTVADLLARFGPILVTRIRTDPAPGTATEADVIEIHDRENRLYELVDGVLVEKTVGYSESYLASFLSHLLNAFIIPRKLGIVAGADGMMRLAAGLVRIPDVSFVSWDRLPDGQVPREPIPDLAPDLAIEVLSESNTRKEMDEKLRDYFTAGVRLVWYVDPPARTVTVYTNPQQPMVLHEGETLDGGAVLPGFSLPLRGLFADPAPAAPSP
jgi:Uma2 family endonuclease